MVKENVDLDELYARISELTSLVARAENITEIPFSNTIVHSFSKAMDQTLHDFEGKAAKIADSLQRAKSIDSMIIVTGVALLDFAGHFASEAGDIIRAKKAKAAAMESLFPVYKELIAQQAIIINIQKEKAVELYQIASKLEEDVAKYETKIAKINKIVTEQQEQIDLLLGINNLQQAVEI